MNMCIHPQEEAPLPWRVSRYDGRGIFDANGNCIVVSKDTKLLKRIIHYANSHAALVEALKKFTDFSFDAEYRKSGYTTALNQFVDLKRNAREILAAAEETK